MDIITSLVVVAVAGLIQTSFQLSVSMLTLLSSHTIGRKQSHRKLLALTNSFLLGASMMTILLLSTTSMILGALVGPRKPDLIVWTISCGLLTGLGIAIWIFYYKKGAGTTLWLPRSLARYLSDRTKKTNQPAEAFSLGLGSVLAELIFIFAPIFISALALISLPPIWQLVGIGMYSVTSLLSLVIVSGLIGSGHSLSRIQKWRESNKQFLRFSAGAGLLILGYYIYVNQVMGTSVLAATGSM